MRKQTLGNGVIVIDKDEHLFAKIQASPSLTGISVSDLRISAESLASLYEIASVNRSTAAENIGHIKRYALMKQLYLQKFSK